MTHDIGLIETFLCAGTRAPFWKNHWRRLRRSARKIELNLKPDLGRSVSAQIRRLKPHVHRARLSVSARGFDHLTFAGYDARWMEAGSAPGERLICLAAPADYPGPWAGMKTTARVELEKLFRVAAERGAADAIFHQSGILCETTRGNIFWIKNGVVHTPSLAVGCLPGVMRAWVIRRLRAWKIPVQQGRYERFVLKKTNAVFRTNALIGVSWVNRVDGIGSWRRPHPLVDRLRRELKVLFRPRS